MITEQDIFNYIFFREKVSDEKINEIVAHKHYAAAIEFYSALKNETERHLTISEKKNLAAKIPIYKFDGKFELLPFRVNDMENGMRLAASSKNNENNINAVSFFSETKEFLCRIVSTQTQRLLYCFSTDQEELKDFKLTLHPAGIEFQCKSNAEPITVSTDLKIEKISFEFQ